MAKKRVVWSRGNSSTGITDIIREDMNKLIGMNDEIIKHTLRYLAQQVLEKADELVPEGPTSNLRQSGRIEDVRRVGDSWVISVKYGNAEVDYAFFVHEAMPSEADLKKPRQYTRSGTGSHYLTRAADEILTDRNIRNAFNDAVRLVGRNTRI